MVKLLTSVQDCNTLAIGYGPFFFLSHDHLSVFTIVLDITDASKSAHLKVKNVKGGVNKNYSQVRQKKQ